MERVAELERIGGDAGRLADVRRHLVGGSEREAAVAFDDCLSNAQDMLRRQAIRFAWQITDGEARWDDVIERIGEHYTRTHEIEAWRTWLGVRNLALGSSFFECRSPLPLDLRRRLGEFCSDFRRRRAAEAPTAKEPSPREEMPA